MKIVALAGGVGGSKLAHGLSLCLSPQDLTVIVNTGDDFEFLGLTICPDLDTVCYTLAGLANPETGWGRKNESYRTLETLAALGGPDWFQLGDLDLATHLERTRRLHAGQPLSEVTRALCAAWGIQPAVLPMSDQPVRTRVQTVDSGELDFQEYFVHRRCEPRVTGFRFAGIETAHSAPGLLEILHAADAVVLCPSNPWVSIDPILALDGVRSALAGKKMLAVSPIVAGRSVRGPAAKMFAELGIQPDAPAVAEHYGALLSAFLMDEQDRKLASQVGLRVELTNTIMKNESDRLRLAEVVLHLIQTL
jgi:LPPG:FO 2-phospho-L-lactate transferase